MIRVELVPTLLVSIEIGTETENVWLDAGTSKPACVGYRLIAVMPRHARVASRISQRRFHRLWSWDLIPQPYLVEISPAA